jgi:hypothetical protein
MFELMGDIPRKGEGEVSFKPSSVTMVASPPRFSMPNPHPFPLTAFAYEPLFRLKSIRPHRPIESRGGTRLRVVVAGGLVRIFPLCRDKEHGFNHVATNASGIQSGMMVSIRGIWTNQRTAKMKGGCHWEACSADGTSGRDQTMHRVRLTSGMQQNEGIIIA